MGILSDIVNEDKVEMCPDACCGKPITECKCGPDCEHCDCHSKNSAMNEGTMIGGLMKYDGQPEGEYADAVEKYKEFMSKPRPPGEATNNMVQGFVFDDELLDNLGDAEEDGDILDVRFIVQSRLEDFFGDDFELGEGVYEAEKRWKQTSMSPAEAIEKYGKENVKVKKGALRNGDDMVEVFVESYSPGDENEDGMVSNCCGAPVMDVYDGHGRCSDCKEMASAEKEEEYYEDSPTGAISGFAPQFQNPKDITNTGDALVHKGQTRGVNDPFDASGTGHADGIGWSQDEFDAADAGFQSALDTANQIKINRYLADLPNDIAKGIANKYGYGVATDMDSGNQFNPSWDGEYDHASNPNYGRDAMDPETIAKIEDPNWRDTFNMRDPKFKNIRPTEATNEEIEAEIQRLKDLIKY